MRNRALLGVLPLLLASCDRPPSSSSAPPPPTASASAVTITQASPPASAASASSASSAASQSAARTFLAFGGKLGSSDLRMVLERTGDHLEGLYTSHDEDVAVQGDMKDASHFVLTELAQKGQTGATLTGTIDGAQIQGTWKGAKAATAAFTAGPLVLGSGEKSFEQTYLGALGSKTHIRMKLKKDGAKLSGVYRYPRSQEDLHLDGTVTEHGVFELAETTAKGARTGTFRGVLLERQVAYGRWSSPDEAHSFPFTLRSGDAFPEPTALPGGGKLVPQEDYTERTKFCAASIFFPHVTGSANKAAEKTLNAALEAAARESSATSCEGATDELRYETDRSFTVGATRPGAFELAYRFYQFTGGAHGMHAVDCYAADLDKGTLTKLTLALLSPESRKKVASVAIPEIKRALTEAGMDGTGTDVTVADETTLCVDGSDLIVQFQEYQVAPYAMGQPSVKIAKANAAPLVAGTPLEPFFK